MQEADTRNRKNRAPQAPNRRMTLERKTPSQFDLRPPASSPAARTAQTRTRNKGSRSDFRIAFRPHHTSHLNNTISPSTPHPAPSNVGSNNPTAPKHHTKSCQNASQYRNAHEKSISCRNTSHTSTPQPQTEITDQTSEQTLDTTHGHMHNLAGRKRITTAQLRRYLSRRMTEAKAVVVARPTSYGETT